MPSVAPLSQKSPINRSKINILRSTKMYAIFQTILRNRFDGNCQILIQSVQNLLRSFRLTLSISNIDSNNGSLPNWWRCLIYTSPPIFIVIHNTHEYRMLRWYKKASNAYHWDSEKGTWRVYDDLIYIGFFIQYCTLTEISITFIFTNRCITLCDLSVNSAICVCAV